jgi:hypothetical protein
LDLIDICVVVQGFECLQRWPKIKISVDNHIVYCDQVVGLQKINYKCNASRDQKKCVIKIDYFDKTDLDTDVDLQGNIVSNQSVSINELWINGVDIIKTRAIHQNIGNYTMTLSPQKYQHFVNHGINVDPTTSTHMFENGQWYVELELPLLSTLTAKHNFTEAWEKVNLTSIVDSLYQQLKICQDLEKNNQQETNSDQ